MSIYVYIYMKIGGWNEIRQYEVGNRIVDQKIITQLSHGVNISSDNMRTSSVKLTFIQSKIFVHGRDLKERVGGKLGWEECNRCYVGETQQNLTQRIKEHKRSIRIHDKLNALFTHIAYHNHSLNFTNAKIIKPIHKKRLRRLCESAIINQTESFNIRPGFCNLDTSIAKMIIRENTLSHQEYG